jgi:release factor glutamine methyltransferase
MPTLNIGSTLDNLQTTIFHLNDTPRLDAQVLLANIMGKPRTWILAHPEKRLTPEQQDKLTDCTARLEAGTPLPYVIGHWEFYNLDFEINPHVLIPRPETELLVDKALEWLQAHPRFRRTADIGTGSGCISISLAHHVPDLQITATDVSKRSLDAARINAIKHGVADRISLIQTDLLESICGTFNLICANLPYIPTTTLQQLAVFGLEPSLALNGGPDGLGLIRRLVHMVPVYLAPRGALMIEIEATQGKTALELASQQFPDSEISLVPDQANHDRLLTIQT